MRESTEDAIASRQILGKYRIRINEALNGVWLNKSAHDLTKKAAYGEWVVKKLSIDKSTDQVIEVLADINKTLEKLNVDPTIAPW